MTNHFFTSIGKATLTLCIACLSFFSAQAQETENDESANSNTEETSLLNEQRLEASHATSWETLIQQEIPGMSPDLIFRTQNKPLIFVDGLMLSQEANLQQILPSATQVGSIQFIKGPEAVAQYGIRGVNGVLIVQTKNAGFDKGLKWGIYNGYRYSSVNMEETYGVESFDLPATSALYESAYLDWSNHKHRIHANYTNQYTFRPSFRGLNGTTYIAYSSMSHSANLHYQGKLNEKMKVQSAGMLQTDDNGHHFYNLNSGLHYTPSDRVQVQFNAGVNNNQNRITRFDSYEDVNNGEQFIVWETRIEKLAISNKEMNLKINAIHPIHSKITLTTETGLSYFNSSQLSKTKGIAEIYSFDGLPVHQYSFSDKDRTQLLHFVNGFAIGGLEIKQWMKFKLGTHFTAILEENLEFEPLYAPYAAIEMDYMKLIEDSGALSRFDFQTSYGQVSQKPLLYFNEEINRYRFQANLNLGFIKDQFKVSTTYFTDKSFGNTNLYTYKGWETKIRATLIKFEHAHWTTGLNSLIIRKFRKEKSAFYVSEFEETRPYPLDWQTGWSNHIQLNSVSLHTQLNLQNSTSIYEPWGYTASVDGEPYHYLNLQEFTLAYNVPASVVEKTTFRRINMAVSGRNLFYTSNSEVSELLSRNHPFIVPAISKQFSFSLGLHF